MSLKIKIIPLHTQIPLRGKDNKDNSITFTNVILNNYSDNFGINTTTEKAFGRTDPMYFYESNTRSLDLEFTTIEADNSDAISVAYALQRFIQLLYPTYNVLNNLSPVLESPPLFNLRVIGPQNKTMFNEIGFVDGFDYKLEEQATANNALQVGTITHREMDPAVAASPTSGDPNLEVVPLKDRDISPAGGTTVPFLDDPFRFNDIVAARYYKVSLKMNVMHREVNGFNAANSTAPGVDGRLAPLNQQLPFALK